MAIDEAILDAHLTGIVPPTLRVYGWEPPAVSIGYGQKLSERVAGRIRSKGFDIVRRPTGGRAVLHLNELTYSFVGSSGPESLFKGGVLSAYKQICEGLIAGLRELGVETALGASSSLYKDAHDCFLATTSADLHYNGKKLVGSAQLRRHHAILQHGSILLDQPQDLMRSLLSERPGGKAGGTTTGGDGERHANLFDILGRSVSIEIVEKSVHRGFEEAFGQELSPSVLTDFELELANKYRLRYLELLNSSQCSFNKTLN